MDEPEILEGSYRVTSEGPEAPWKHGEPVFPAEAAGNFLVFLLVFVGGPFIFWAIYHLLAPAT